MSCHNSGADLALGFAESHEVLLSPLLKSVWISLDGTPSLGYSDCTTQFGIHKLAEGAFDSTVNVNDEDVKDH